jgi:hypothetical protein
MKILRLKSENVKRISVVEIVPDGNLIRIGGKNGSGKSSVLDSIAYALGGTSLVPSEPIRKGETDAKVTIELDDLIVTRKFTREYLPCDCGVTSPGDVPIIGDDQMHLDACASRTKFGETKSTLIVTNQEGARYPSPQAVLDKLLGKLTFDPLAFARLSTEPGGPKKQNEILRQLAGVNTASFDETRKVAASQRTMLKKTHEIKSAQLLTLPIHTGVPDAEVSMEAVSAEMLRAEELRKLATDANRVMDTARDKVAQAEQALASHHTLYKELERRLLEEGKKLAGLNNTHEIVQEELRLATEDRQRALLAVPDFEVIRKKLADIESDNTKVRANRKRAEAQVEVDRLAGEIIVANTAITEAETAKQTALETAKFPVVGLGLNDDGVTFDAGQGSVPFEQASSSEQLRVSVAISIALNPDLRILLIRNGNLLDSDSLKLIAEQAEVANTQVWMEWVGTSSDISVLLEDGHTVAVQTV